MPFYMQPLTLLGLRGGARGMPQVTSRPISNIILFGHAVYFYVNFLTPRL